MSKTRRGSKRISDYGGFYRRSKKGYGLTAVYSAVILWIFIMFMAGSYAGQNCLAFDSSSKDLVGTATDFLLNMARPCSGLPSWFVFVEVVPILVIIGLVAWSVVPIFGKG